MNILKELENIVYLNKSIDIKKLKDFSFEERETLRNINDLSYNISTKNLKSLCKNKDLIPLINKSEIPLDYFGIFTEYCNEKDLPNLITNFDNDLYDRIVLKFGEISLNNLSEINELMNVFYVSLYYKKINEDDISNIIVNLSKSIKQHNSDISQNTFYNILNIFKLDIFSIIEGNYYLLIESIFNYENKTIDLEILNYLNDIAKLYKKNDMFNDMIKDENFYVMIIKTLRKAKEYNKLEQVKEIFIRFGNNKTSLEWICYLFKNNTSNIFDIDNLVKLSYIEINEKTKLNPIEILYNSFTINLLYQDIPTSWYAEELENKLSFLIDNCKKKGFKKLIDEYSRNKTKSESIFLNSEYSILFNDKFSTIINLNTLNLKNLDDLATMQDHSLLSFFDENISLTFNEFKVLYNFLSENRRTINLDIYYKLLDLKIDLRLKLISQLPCLELKGFCIKSKENVLQFSNEDITTRIAKLIKEKSYKDRLNSLKFKLKRTSDYQYLLYFLNIEKFKKYNNIKWGSDIEFVLLNYKDIEIFGSILKAKEEFYMKNDKFNFLISNANLSSKFIEKYKTNLIDFCDKGLLDVYYGLYKNSNIKKFQLENLNILVKAEIMGKLKDVKYKDEDFELEIGLDISQETKNEWKLNSSFTNHYKYEETDDFDRVIRLGEYPVDTCQHWEDGIYSECLLSNFDTNKKMLISLDKQDRVNTRALFRLTKYSKERIITKSTKLSFEDVDDTISSEIQDNDKEKLVLFLEKVYTNLDHSQKILVQKDFVKFAIRKAKELNAELVISKDYSSILRNNENFEEERCFIFISHSKNGYQYNDSLAGEATVDSEGKYHTASLYKYIG